MGHTNWRNVHSIHMRGGQMSCVILSHVSTWRQGLSLTLKIRDLSSLWPAHSKDLLFLSPQRYVWFLTPELSVGTQHSQHFTKPSPWPQGLMWGIGCPRIFYEKLPRKLEEIPPLGLPPGTAWQLASECLMLAHLESRVIWTYSLDLSNFSNTHTLLYQQHGMQQVTYSSPECYQLWIFA